MFDESELSGRTRNRKERRDLVAIRSGRNVSVYDFEFPSRSQDCAAIDRGIVPNYRFLLEIEAVVMPVDREYERRSELAWSPDSFTVAKNRKETRLEESPGYYVDAERERAILECLQEVLLVDTDSARVLPYSNGRC